MQLIKGSISRFISTPAFQSLFFLMISFFIFSAKVVAQTNKITLSGLVKESKGKEGIPYVNVALKNAKDSSFVLGTITNEEGRFTMADVKSGNYNLEISYIGFQSKTQPVLVGQLSAFLDLGNIELDRDSRVLDAVTVTSAQASGVSDKMDKKSFSIADNVSQAGGSVLQAMNNLPGVTTSQDGKVQLRGSDKVAVLIDGKQTALTGFGSQTGLDNIPASAIDRIEIINNPSAKYDANGNAGIINIIYKKNKQEGFNGKIGLMTGLGALWQKRENLPGIRPQYQRTPKINPSLSLNYRKNKVNTFLQGDWLYTETLNRNEFTTRFYDNGDIVQQQAKRNRNTSYATVKTGVDYNINSQNSLTVSGFFNREKIIDRGDIPYFNNDLSKRNRLWQFLEDEVKYTVTATVGYLHKFKQPGHSLNINYNYTWHREDEKYFFTNIMPTFTGQDAFAMLSDEYVNDFTVDYVRPLKHGRFEGGLKFRLRSIPINMQFFPGLNSPIDFQAGGFAEYRETIPAAYGNYVYESNKFELEAGLRMEYVRVDYEVNPNHNTYKSDGYTYTQPFPNVRLAYKLNDNNKVSFFYNRRVDRPNEVDIRIFPKYDEPELLKVGNPALRPQFTNSFELGYKSNISKGSIYTALYHRIIDGTITRIATQVPGSTILYNVFQNAGRSYNTGAEVVLQQNISKAFSYNASANVYRNRINSFSVVNRYPVPSVYTSETDNATSGNVKLNGLFHLPKQVDVQLTGIYLAPDIIPQGRIGSRLSVDLGIKKQVQKGKGELFLNGTDILNTLNIRKDIKGNGFRYETVDYYETQVFRLGYSYKF
ncbi:TonB-dependent receptor [Segetibacter sp.]|jgi:outer membrane receptor protein involved in Fe transport|uniref:TonB-dependent receptor domain-containing protein n=1 Tax=Segetibacter sp. TaxID=2231182 RepID=UPI0026241AB3|nr:TonB-dependent receptor [Segetibacter sp.]MCW3079379.1 TonB-dependent receptor [Segetibacter sp.]